MPKGIGYKRGRKAAGGTKKKTSHKKGKKK
jgi:hypothetical protein